MRLFLSVEEGRSKARALALKSDVVIENFRPDVMAKLGLGYEELNGIFPHNPEAYNEEGNCRDPERLRKFIKNHLFLARSIFDYDKIPRVL